MTTTTQPTPVAAPDYIQMAIHQFEQRAALARSFYQSAAGQPLDKIKMEHDQGMADAISGLRADWEASERRAIEIGDTLHSYVLVMQAFMIDALREAGAPEAPDCDAMPESVAWINNTLVGPGHAVPEEALTAEGQEWFDAELAKHEAFRKLFPAPGRPVVGDLRRQLREVQSKVSSAAHAGNLLRDRCHGASVAAGWWHDLKTGESVIQRPHAVGEKLALIHSEISEAMEGHRKGLMDDKLPHRKMIEVELADAVIRIADLSGAMGLDLGGAIEEKMAFNAIRPDHKPEARMAEGGKAY